MSNFSFYLVITYIYSYLSDSYLFSDTLSLRIINPMKENKTPSSIQSTNGYVEYSIATVESTSRNITVFIIYQTYLFLQPYRL